MINRSTLAWTGSASLALLLALPALASAQDRLQVMPGYSNYVAKAPIYQQNSFTPGTLGGGGGFGGGRGAMGGAAAGGTTWSADGKSLEYSFAGKRFRVELKSGKIAEVAGDAAPAPVAPGGRGAAGGAGRGGVGAGGMRGGQGGAASRCGVGTRRDRGRQDSLVASPNGALVSIYRRGNLAIANADCSGEYLVTRDGSEATGIKYGTGSWVYGEELGQTSAMWWNKASDKVGYYRFDESKLVPFYLAMDQSKINTTLDQEKYPKAGADNPLADIYVYDLNTKQSVRIDVRSGQPNVDNTVGYYVYRVQWSPDDKELLLNRANRNQNVIELIGCNPATGNCRVILHEEWPTGWVDEAFPKMQYLADNNRFILTSERSGFANYYLYDLSGKLINQITSLNAEVVSILRVDEKSNTMWYTARDGDNFMKVQLHRVGLDGKGDVRLTDPRYTHSVTLSPDGKYFIDTAQNHETAPFTRLVDGQGKVVVELGKSDLSRPQAAGMRPVEQFTFTAADGKTTLYGTISKPIDFDPARKYPVILNVYGGPASGSSVPTENFAYSSPTTEYGFVVVTLHTRASPGMGKRTLDDIYMKLGQTEIDDMAAGIRELAKRPWINADRVGITGTSYGGYSSAMALLRYPEVFHSAVANSAVTAWYHYDTIYTERYMRTPQLNPDGYEKGSAMTYAPNLKGRLMIYYGTADNNVHPNNAMQLIQALQRAGKSFEVQVGPDQGHTAVNNARQWEFFIETLVMNR